MNERDHRNPATTRVHFMGIGGVSMQGLARWYRAEGFAVSGCDAVDGAAQAALRADGIPVAVGHDAATSTTTSTSWSRPWPCRGTTRRCCAPANSAWRSARASNSSATCSPAGRRSASPARTARAARPAWSRRCSWPPRSTPRSSSAPRCRGWSATCATGPDPTWRPRSTSPTRGSPTCARRSPSSPTSRTTTSPASSTSDATTTRAWPTCRRPPERFALGAQQVLYCADWPGLDELLGDHPRGFATASRPTPTRASRTSSSTRGARFTLALSGGRRAAVELAVPGHHNVLNAAAALCAVELVGLDAVALAPALATFAGVGRRWQVWGRVGGAEVVDDYAHHPTEVHATLTAARAGGRRVRAVLQPHRWVRTARLWPALADAAALADEVLVLDVYAAGEAPIAGEFVDRIVDRVRERGTHGREPPHAGERRRPPARDPGGRRPGADPRRRRRVARGARAGHRRGPGGARCRRLTPSGATRRSPAWPSPH
jgi:UDP-N-acetylmuramate--alanine ligase